MLIDSPQPSCAGLLDVSSWPLCRRDAHVHSIRVYRGLRRPAAPLAFANRSSEYGLGRPVVPQQRYWDELVQGREWRLAAPFIL